MRTIILAAILMLPMFLNAQAPPVEAGVSQELARWRAERYSDVRYKLNLTLEKMSPVLKGTIEIRVRVSSPHLSKGSAQAATGDRVPIVLDWRKIRGHEDKSTITKVSINGKAAIVVPPEEPAVADKSVRVPYENEHLIFRDGVVAGENVIKLDFTSPILTSGSAITRYVDKEDGSEYIYSLFVPSDASTAFPVFDQPDLKARFGLTVFAPEEWTLVSNSLMPQFNSWGESGGAAEFPRRLKINEFSQTKPISTYVFAFAAGPWERVSSPHVSKGSTSGKDNVEPSLTVGLPTPETSIYVRKSQAAKFRPHAAEVFRLNREAVKYFEQYFDYKFPWPNYDLVLIPEFPLGGMEHAGATFLRESSIIFPQEPTKNDHISRALLMFHEASHQWFGDTVTMRWFDDLWLKEGFATFTAYKAMEKIMPEMLAWKVFYERVKQAAYQTDSTKGTTPIYQEISNLSAAKSAYGAIVYSKAPAFLRQAEFYLGEDKFQTAVRAFLKKHEFGNAGWENLVTEFSRAAGKPDLEKWAKQWVTVPGLPIVTVSDLRGGTGCFGFGTTQRTPNGSSLYWQQRINSYAKFADEKWLTWDFDLAAPNSRHSLCDAVRNPNPVLVIPNSGDYGYGIFLLDEKSRDHVLKNIRREKDPFLRSMMWGALWDSVREGELDPRAFVELVVKNLAKARTTVRAISSTDAPELDESTVQLLLSRVSVAMSYYIPAPDIALTNVRASAPEDALRSRVEDMLIERMQNAPTLGQRITYYRAFLNIAASDKARVVLKELLAGVGSPHVSKGSTLSAGRVEPSLTVGLRTRTAAASIPLKTKDKFDIVTRLLILGDPDAPKLLADLEKTETSDDAKRYAYAAKAGIPTAENKAKYWNDFVSNKEISESWIEAAFGPWNSIRHSELTLPYLERALQELPNHKRSRKIFFVNGWLGAFIGGQRSPEALAIVNKFLAENPKLDNDLRLKVLENVDLIERAVRIRGKFKN